MGSWLSGITGFIAAHPNLAYGAIFLFALSESVPIIGAAVPGTAVIVAVSALVPTGAVKLWPLLAAATFGAIVGDGLSFWLGHRYHRQILALWPLSRHPELIARSEGFFERHGNKSVFLARFTPGVRAIVPLMAGALQMPVRRFYGANVISAVVWAPAHILPGVLIGASLGVLGAAGKPIAILLVLLAVALWGVVRLVRVALRRGIPRLLDAVERVRAWARGRDSWVGRGVLELLDPERHEARVLAAIAGLLVGAAWLFFGILEDVVSGDPLVRADAAIYQALQDLRTPPGDAIMIAITEIGDTAVTAAVALAVLLWLAWKRAWRTAGYWLAAVIGASALNVAIKAALHRPRPGPPLYEGWSAFSFPSGHTTVNAVLYGFLAFLIAREVRPRARVPIAIGAAALIVLIAFSRLYLGAHWLSDVSGGLAFGIALLALLGLLYGLGRPEAVGPVGLSLVAGLAVVLAGGADVYLHHTADTRRYAIDRSAPPALSIDAWSTTGWQSLPAYRIDLTGEVQEPLTVQWAGELPALRDKLTAAGWKVPAPWTAVDALGWLTTTGAAADLPVVPQFAGGRLPGLTLVRPSGPNSRLVLRLWATDIAVSNGATGPLWIGSVVEERLYRPLSLFSWARMGQSFDAPRDAVAEALPDGRLLPRSAVGPDQGWDGRVLLAGAPGLAPR